MSCIGSCFNATLVKRDQSNIETLRDSIGSDRYANMMNEYNISEGRQNSSSEISFITKLTFCFDFSKNFQRVFADNKKAYYQFTYLDGIRCFALIYTIFANDFWARISVSQNITDIYSLDLFKNGWSYMFIVGAQYGIDIFLFVSGVSSFLYYSELLKKTKPEGLIGHISFFIKAIMSKLISILPLYFVLEVLYYQVIPPLVDGPINSLMSDYTQTCKNGGFWYSLIMFGNLNVNYQCMNWCWYLGIEFQAFIFLLVSLILFKWKKFAGYFTLVLWIIASVVSTFCIWYSKNLTLPVGVIPRESINDEYMLVYYAQSFTRWSAYMFGGLIGCILVSKIDHIPFEFHTNPVSMAD